MLVLEDEGLNDTLLCIFTLRFGTIWTENFHGSNTWAPHSPDLIPLDSFFWHINIPCVYLLTTLLLTPYMPQFLLILVHKGCSLCSIIAVYAFGVYLAAVCSWRTCVFHCCPPLFPNMLGEYVSLHLQLYLPCLQMCD